MPTVQKQQRNTRKYYECIKGETEQTDKWITKFRVVTQFIFVSDIVTRWENITARKRALNEMKVETSRKFLNIISAIVTTRQISFIRLLFQDFTSRIIIYEIYYSRCHTCNQPRHRPKLSPDFCRVSALLNPWRACNLAVREVEVEFTTTSFFETSLFRFLNSEAKFGTSHFS